MLRTVIANSTPVIALRNVNSLYILKELYREIIIPNAVYQELTVKDSQVLSGYDWIHVKSINNQMAKEMFATALHDGEVEVMLLAKEMNADLIIMDDGLARQHAKYLGLNITGTVGVVLRAKNNGIISAVKPVLIRLINNGFYLSNNVYQEILRLTGEHI
jgi:predicted nucleic acid-binding protein